jgi:DUF4097 and DUF4098 domain-containing protein YvlB
MIKALTSTALVLALAPFAPAAAEAQVYPDRVRIAAKARAVVESTYQRRRDENNREENVERTTRTLKLGANGVLTLGNIAGDIAITRANGQDTTVEIVKTARGRDANDVREQLQMVQVDVTERAGRADIRTRYPSNEEARRNNRRNFNVSVAYNVSAPAGTRISIESISGSIKVTDIKGDVTANTVSGDVRITGSGRINAAKTISGTVEIADAEIDGALESSSVSGDVIMRRVTARRLDASSVSGNIKFDDLKCDRVSAKTVSGAVAFVGTLARNGRYDLGSFSGDVHLYLTGGTGFEVDANSSSGDIRSDFDIVTRGAQTTTRRGRRPVLSGTFGDGSAVLDLTTFSGSIIISKR